MDRQDYDEIMRELARIEAAYAPMLQRLSQMIEELRAITQASRERRQDEEA